MTGALVPLAFFAIPVLIWLLFRSHGYKRQPLDGPPPGGGWQATGERFVDPRSGALLEVWFHPESGERVYVRVRSGGDAR